MDLVQDQTVDGAMYQSLMKMDMREPDVLMLEMTHGIVVINMILLLAHQDGLVIKPLENVLWPTQEMVLEVNQLAKTTANQEVKPSIDAIPQLVSAKNVKKEILDVTPIETLPVETANPNQDQLPRCSNATKLIQNNQHVMNAQRIRQLGACQEVKLVIAALQSNIFSNVIQKRLHAYRPSNKVTLNKLVMLSADTLHHKSFLEPGEVLWLRKENQRILIWEKLI